jgi:serine/threonine protein kinase
LFRIPFEELVFIKQIGRGGAATVHQALWNGQVVAVKKLKSAEEDALRAEEDQDIFSKAFKEFSREVYIMR